jgi:hypothetical protein
MLQLLVRGCLFYWLCYWDILSYFDHATFTSNEPQGRILVKNKTNKGHNSREDKRNMAWEEDVWSILM